MIAFIGREMDLTSVEPYADLGWSTDVSGHVMHGSRE